MAQVLTAGKLIAMLGLLCTAAAAEAQSYGKCAYGRSRYNNNTCPTIAVAQKADTGHTAHAKAAAPLRVFPNPAQQYCMVQLPPGFSKQTLKMQVFNNRQELVLSKDLPANTQLHKIPLPLLANGLYQVKVSTGTTELSTFIEVQH